jgi:endoglycosylceramidase
VRRLAVMVGMVAALTIVGSAVAAVPGGPLHSDGRFLRDAQGRVVILHGLFAAWKIAGKWAPDDSAADPAGFTAADADRFAGLGLNAVRLAYFWRALEPTQGSYDDGYLDRVARVQRLLADRGVFAVLDSHQDMYNERFGGLGFPDWATFDDGVPLGQNLGFPADYFLPATSHAFDNFWLDQAGVLGTYAAQLAHVADRFAHDPMVIGYDLINEPWPGSQYPSCVEPAGCPQFDIALLRPAEDAFAAAVHAASPRQLAFYEPTLLFDGGVRSWLGSGGPATGPAGLSFHDECATRAIYQSTHGQGAQANDACPTTDAQVVADARSTAAQLGGPPLETEVAAASDSDYASLECLLERDDRNAVGWTYGLSWRSGELRALDPTKAAVLRRVYPRAIAGTPDAYGYDPRTGDFALRYVRAPSVHAPTVIEVPRAVYPGGYTASVSGGRVVSAPGADLLEIRNRPHAGTVSVSVAPAPGSPVVARPQFPACPAGLQETTGVTP